MTWGLALSGGGAWGIANGGVLDVLAENDLKPDYIAGSSMGAIIGALYALGHPPSIFPDLLKEISVLNIAGIAEKPLAEGLHGGLLKQNITHFLEPIIGDATIGDCEIPFVCIAGKVGDPIQWQNILKGSFTGEVMDMVTPHIFQNETRILDAIMASSAIPVLFAPVEVDDDTFIDLCTFGAVPSRSLRYVHNPDTVIATMTTPTYDVLRKIAPVGIRNFLNAGQESLQASLDAADFVIEPRLKGNVASFNKAQELFEAGREEAKKHIDAIHACIV